MPVAHSNVSLKSEDLGSLIQILERIDDPRLCRRRLHSLDNILFITLFAVAGGALSWRQIREFG